MRTAGGGTRQGFQVDGEQRQSIAGSVGSYHEKMALSPDSCRRGRSRVVIPLGCRSAIGIAATPARTGRRHDGRLSGARGRRHRPALFEGATTPEAWQAMRPRLKRELFSMLGLWPVPEKTPLQAKVTGTVERDGVVVIEKLHFQSRPGLYVTGNLYRPKDSQGRLPAVLYVCGHASKGRDGCKAAFQDHGMWYARNGYICLIIDTLQLGELAGVHHGTYRYGRWWWQAIGYTPAGVECWNGIRAIDYLTSRPDVDPARIGVTGISGGGAATFWIAAADDRVACAVPISGMSDLESYVTHKVVNEHCDCMFLVNTERWEWTTIAALVAPRPLLFANSDQDSIFPMDGNRGSSNGSGEFYQMLGSPQNVAEHISHGGHDYRADLRHGELSLDERSSEARFEPGRGCHRPTHRRQAAPRFPRRSRLSRRRPQREDRRDLRHPGPTSTAGTLRPRRVEAGDDRAVCARPHSERSPSRSRRLGRNPRPRPEDGCNGWRRSPASRSRCSTCAGRPGRDRCMLVVLNENERLDRLPDWATPYVADDAVVVLAPRGVGPTAWTRKNPPNYVERAHALLGRTVDEGRVRDIMATAGWIAGPSRGTARIRLAGRNDGRIPRCLCRSPG